MNTPKSLLEATRQFLSPDRAHEYLAQLRWPDGNIPCPTCGSVEKHGFLKNQNRWKCRSCKRQFSVKVGTIFEDSKIGLDKWLLAVWMVVNCKNGASSCEIARALEVTQKTAWFMNHRIREALSNGTFEKLNGEVEADETFIGGKARNMHKWQRVGKGRGSQGKAAVQGMIERGGKVIAVTVPNLMGPTLRGNIERFVHPNATVYTDEFKAYDMLGKKFDHHVIDHMVGYVDGRVSTNGIECFWSLLKRGLKGTYVSVEPYHLMRYVDEQVFRFNERKSTDGERFALALSQIAGRRLKYAELTGKAL